MNLQQINLDSLHQRFFQKLRIKSIAKFVQKHPLNESSPHLEDLFRNHAEEPIEDDEEIELRDDLDFLLAYYSLLEMASMIGYIPTALPDHITIPAVRILNQPDVRRYYQRHYRCLLPELFRLRLEGRNKVLEVKYPDEAAAVFSQFIFMVGWLENDQSVSTFLWFLDDGIKNGCDWTDLVKPLKNPNKFFKLILKPRKNQKAVSLGLKGLLAFVQTCRDLESLLSQAEKLPLLQSAIWHYHSYWFSHMKQKIGHELKEALQAFQKWEGFSDNKELYRKEIQDSLEEVDGALKSLFDGHYGKPLNEAARALRQKKHAIAAVGPKLGRVSITRPKTMDLISIALRFPDAKTADRIADVVSSLQGQEIKGSKLVFPSAAAFNAAHPTLQSFAIGLVGGLVGEAGKKLGQTAIKWLIAKIREQLLRGQKVTVVVKGQKLHIGSNTDAKGEQEFSQKVIQETLESQ